MENVKLLSLSERIKSARPDALCFEDDFFLFDVDHSPVPDRPFKMDTYGFFLCQEGSTQVTIDLMPYELRPGMMVVNVLLKSSALTVQQIADELNFPSQSFFGKYFKRLVEQSPKEYREGKPPR